MDPRSKVYYIIFSPLMRFFHNTLHLSFFWPLLIVMILFNICLWRSPKWKIKNSRTTLDKINAIGFRIALFYACCVCLYVAISEQVKKPFLSEGYFSADFTVSGNVSRKIFLLYSIVSSLGAYRVFRNGILPYMKKKVGDKKAKIDIMTIVYFVMLSVFAITSLFVVLGVIKT